MQIESEFFEYVRFFIGKDTQFINVSPNSRETKLDRLRGQKNMKLQVLGIKVSFFHENFDQSLTSCTPQYLHELIEKYVIVTSFPPFISFLDTGELTV